MQFDTTINRWHTASERRVGSTEVTPASPGRRRSTPTRAWSVSPSSSTGPTAASPSASTPTTPPTRMLRPTGGADLARGVHDHRLQRHRPPALRQRHGTSLHPGPPGLHVQPRLRRGQDLTFDDEVKVLDLPAPAVNADLGCPSRLIQTTTGRRATTPMPFASPTVVGGVRPLPRLVDRRRQHVRVHDVHHLRQRRGPRRDSSPPCRAGRVDQRRSTDQGLRAGQRDGPAAASAAERSRVSWRPRRPVGQGSAEVGSLVDRAGSGRSPWLVPPGPFRRRRLCRVEPERTPTSASGRPRRLLRGVQNLLTTFGILSRVYQGKDAAKQGSFSYTKKSGETVTYGQFCDLRPSDHVGVDRGVRPAHRLLSDPQAGALA